MTIRRPFAFTLIELLVVIGIIALLLSILLPALNRAKAAAKQSICLSNLRQLMIADNNYAADNKGMFCSRSGFSSASSYDTIDGVYGIATTYWWYAYASSSSGQRGFSFAKGFLGRYLKQQNVIECPSLAGYDFPVGNASWNTYAGGGYPLADVNNIPPVGYGAVTLSAKKYAGVIDASATVLYGDSIGIGGSPALGFSFIRSPSLNAPSLGAATCDSFHGRHINGSGNVAFVDGHAESVPVQNRPQTTYTSSLTTPAGSPFYALISQNHIGPATPTRIDTTLVGANYKTACSTVYDYWFWANKSSKK